MIQGSVNTQTASCYLRAVNQGLRNWRLGALAFGLVGLTFGAPVYSQDLAPPQENVKPISEGEPATQDIYQVPETDNVVTLQLFIQRVNSVSPRSKEELQNHRQNLPIAIETASKRILELTNDPASPAYIEARYNILATRIIRIPTLSSEDRKQLGLAILERLASPTEATATLPLVKSFVVELESARDSLLLAEQSATLAELLKTSDDERFQQMAKFLEGMQRRHNLKGQKLNVAGIDADEVEWTWEKILANHSGESETKLVYLFIYSSANSFSDTELDRLKVIYSKFRKRGLEIVLADVNAAPVRKNSKPAGETLICPTLQMRRAEKENFVSELSLTKIPFGIVLDREGKVIESNIRFDGLEPLLDRELGVASE